MSLLFNTLSGLVITFLSRSKHLFISWLQSPSAVILEPKKMKSLTVSTLSPSVCHEAMGLDTMISVFWMLSFKSVFHSPLSLSSRDSLVQSSLLSAIRVVSSVYLKVLIFLPAILIPAISSPLATTVTRLEAQISHVTQRSDGAISYYFRLYFPSSFFKNYCRRRTMWWPTVKSL